MAGDGDGGGSAAQALATDRSTAPPPTLTQVAGMAGTQDSVQCRVITHSTVTVLLSDTRASSYPQKYPSHLPFYLENSQHLKLMRNNLVEKRIGT